ncbi:alpha/beta hydrolase [Nocardia sp. NPDC050718]|uniref:alpha/beta fold hydrolase n=1 Tax=unclassified Nocardia TaxID=2637762 RepID=UPI0033D468F1
MSATRDADTTGVAFTGGAGRLAGDLWGGSGRAAVVLAHGGGQTRHSWRRTAADLHRHGHTVATFDARGHGDSDWSTAAEYSFDDLTGDLADVVAQVRWRTGVGRPVLVGASMGGIAALLALAADPGLAAALVLVDVTPKVEPDGVSRVHRFVTGAPNGFGDLDEVARAVSAYNPHRRTPATPDGLRKNVRRGADGRWYWHWDPAFFQVRREVTAQGLQRRLERAAQRIAVPTLLIRGTASDIATDSGVALLHRLIPHAVVADISGAGHMVAGDDNDVFAVALRTFLDEL